MASVAHLVLANSLGDSSEKKQGTGDSICVHTCVHLREDMLIGYLLSVWCQGIRGLVFHMSDRCSC